MTTITLSLSVEAVNIVLMGLSKLPYEMSAQHINTIQQQALEQMKPAEDKAD
jgi:hypothetical protein